MISANVIEKVEQRLEGSVCSGITMVIAMSRLSCLKCLPRETKGEPVVMGEVPAKSSVYRSVPYSGFIRILRKLKV